MERKIGEIFKYNGEWYQCLKSPDGSCKHCDMDFEKCPIPIKECTESGRSDNSYVIFKKLEKFGNPYISSRNKKRYQLYRCFCLPIITKDRRIEIGEANWVGIEIKQNKEDMEEGKLDPHMEKVIDEATQKMGEEIGRQIEANINKQRMKPFNLELAKQGKPVCTWDGRKARIICFDRVGFRPIIALVKHKDSNSEYMQDYMKNGRKDKEGVTNCDLMMLPEKKEGWVNIYALNTCYSSKEEAEANIDRDYEHEYVRTVKIEWEE